MPAKTTIQVEADSQTKTESFPKNWPEEIHFLTDQTYTPAVTADQIAALSRTTIETVSYAKVPADALKTSSPLVEIQTITDEKHPAYGQKGLFASRHLEPDTFVCLYLGRVHINSLSDTDPHSDYDLAYDRETGLSIDSARSGNEARFANDYRGIAERPNTEFRDCFIQVKSTKRADGTKWERR